MKHKIKVVCYFIFILAVLYLGVREINYRNYQIVDSGTKEVFYTKTQSDNFYIYFLGERITIEKETIDYIENILSRIKN